MLCMLLVLLSRNAAAFLARALRVQPALMVCARWQHLDTVQVPFHLCVATCTPPLKNVCVVQVMVDESGRVTAGKSNPENTGGPGNFLQRVSASMMPGDGRRT